VLSVTSAGAPGIGAFELDPDSGVFHDVSLETIPGTDSGVTENLRTPGGRMTP
jgi:hypothetical protein